MIKYLILLVMTTCLVAALAGCRKDRKGQECVRWTTADVMVPIVVGKTTIWTTQRQTRCACWVRAKAERPMGPYEEPLQCL